MSTPEYGSRTEFFFDTFLKKPASALPKGAQWVLSFDGCYNETGSVDYPQVLPQEAIIKGANLEPRAWSIKQAIETTLETDYQKTKGCMYAQAVQIPGENNQVNPEGLQQSGFIRTMVGGGRDVFENLSISFLETNISFVDNVIRPWVVATSHLGMIARSGKDNYRCNITVCKLGVLTPDMPPYPLIKYTFYGVCPISVTGEEYNYTQTSSPINREATFVYHYYTVDSVAQGTNNSKDSTNPAIIYNNLNIPLPYSTSVEEVDTFNFNSPTKKELQEQNRLRAKQDADRTARIEAEKAKLERARIALEKKANN